MKAKQATNIFKRNSLFFKANIKISFVALNQIRNDSKNERDFKRLFLDSFGIVAFDKTAHTSAHIVSLSSISTLPKCDVR